MAKTMLIPCSPKKTRRMSSTLADSPTVWLAVAWSIALLCWMVAPEKLVYYLIPAGRHLSITSWLFLCLCAASVSLGMKGGVHLGRTSQKWHATFRDAWRRKSLALLILVYARRPCVVLVCISLFAQILHIGLVLSGGWSGFGLDVIVDYRRMYYGSTIGGVTTLKMLALPAYCVATTCRGLASRHGLKRYVRAFAMIRLMTLLVPLVSAALGTRLIAIGWLIADMYLSIGIKVRIEKARWATSKIGKSLLYVAVGLVLLYAVGHYLRWYSRVAMGEVESEWYLEGGGFMESAVLAFLSYPFRTINNCMVVVDYVERHTYFWRSWRWIYTGLGLEQFDPGGLIASVTAEMEGLQASGLAYFGATNISLPGYLFLDMGWFCLLAVMCLGLCIGYTYELWKKTALFGMLVMPLIIIAVADSWRTDIFFRSIIVIGILGSIATCVAVERGVRREVSAGRFVEYYR